MIKITLKQIFMAFRNPDRADCAQCMCVHMRDEKSFRFMHISVKSNLSFVKCNSGSFSFLFSLCVCVCLLQSHTLVLIFILLMLLFCFEFSWSYLHSWKKAYASHFSCCFFVCLFWDDDDSTHIHKTNPKRSKCVEIYLSNNGMEASLPC